MKSELSKMKMLFFQGEWQKALDSVDSLLKMLDPDDDDEREILRDIVAGGFGSGHTLEFVSFLEQHGFDFSLTWPGKGGLALLFAESACRDAVLFERLVTLGMDPFLPRTDGNTALHVLAARDRSSWDKVLEPFLGELVHARGDLSGWMQANAYGATPLHLGVLHGHEQLIQAILSEGVDPDLLGTAPWQCYSHVLRFDGVTALQLACHMGNENLVTRLLEAGAHDDRTDPTGHTACFYAVEKPPQLYCKAYYAGIPNEQRILEDKGRIIRRLACTDSTDDQGNTPLLHALNTHHFDKGGFCALFVELGADVNHANHHGVTPLMAAVQGMSKDSVKTLVAAGADLNARDGAGDTALHMAVVASDEKLARLLIKKGADAQIANNAGVTAGELAAKNGLDTVLELLL